MALVTIKSKNDTEIVIKDSRITMAMKKGNRIHLYLTNGIVVNFDAGEVVFNWIQDLIDAKNRQSVNIESDMDVVVCQPEMAVLRV